MKKYFCEIHVWESDYSDKFVASEDKKKWLDCIIKKYICSEIYMNGWYFAVEDISNSIEWIEITDEEYKILSKYLSDDIPLKEYFEKSGMELSDEDMIMVKTWTDVDGKILKLEESTQDDLLNLLIKLKYELDIDLEKGFVEACEYKGKLMDNGIKSLEMSDNTVYLSKNEAEEYNDLENIITYEYLKNKYEENRID